MKKYLLALLSIGFVLYGCSKDDDDNGNTNKEKYQLVTSATWKYDTAAIDYDKNGTPETPLPSGIIQTCEKDNTITFKSDSTGIVNEGATKCNAANPQTTGFRWWLKESGTVLYTPDPLLGGFSGDIKIVELSSTKMRVIKEVPISIPGLPTTSVNVVLDLKH